MTTNSTSVSTSKTALFSWSVVAAPVLPLIIALALWVFSMRDVDPGRMTNWGLISVMPFGAYIALAILACGFIYVLTRTPLRESFLVLYSIAFILMIHGTPNVLYGTVRYPWAWKHIGIVDYIQRWGMVNPYISNLDAYHNWPGFFSLNALITQVAGLQSAEQYAGWGPAFFNLMFAGSLLLLYRALTTNRRMVWMAVWIFILGNWVGQDYFAPQAISYFFYILILGILLNWFSVHPADWAAVKRLRFLYWLKPAEVVAARPAPAINIWQRLGLMLVVLALFAAINATHQLTPFMAIIAVAALIVFGILRWRTLPFFMLAMVVYWALVPARVFYTVHFTGIFDTTGTVLQNFFGSFANLGALSPEQASVALFARGLTGSIILLAGVGFIMRVRSHHFDLPVLLLAVAPAPLVALNDYGGEVLYRVYFFALPFLAFLAAGAFFPVSRVFVSAGKALLAGAASLVLIVGLLVAYYGKDQQYYSTPDEVKAMTWLLNNAPYHSMIVELTRDYPSQFRNYEYFRYVPLNVEPPDNLRRFLNNPASELYEWMSDTKYAQSYFVVTRTQLNSLNAYGDFPAGGAAKIIQSVMTSKNFKLVYSNDDARIYTNYNR